MSMPEPAPAPAPAGDVFPQEHPWTVLQRILGDIARTAPLGELRSALAGCRIMAGLHGPWDADAAAEVGAALVARRQAALQEVGAVDALLLEHFSLDLSAHQDVQVYRVGEEFYAATSAQEALDFYEEQTEEPATDMVAEPEDMHVRLPDEKVCRSWQDVVNEALGRGERPPFWVGSTYE